jgi:hypothetical protein
LVAWVEVYSVSIDQTTRSNSPRQTVSQYTKISMVMPDANIPFA